MEIFHEVEFWVAIAFLIAVGIVWYKGKGQIAGALDARAEKIRADLDEARRLRAEAEAKLAEFQRKQRDAIAEAQSIIARAQAEAERAAAQAEKDLEIAIARREAQARDRIAQTEAKALAEVRGIVVDIVITATRQILRDSIDPAKASSLIDAAIADLPPRLH